ncbi:MAG: B12-binding domain-containing radical SAM protein [Vicinamibacteraceae bacterium]|nr:B12-binding domain-containing radical SAM protein [Vicinamibacteraceae bacterium]
MNRGAGSLDALLIGHEEQENLGLRSILATLRAEGFRAELLPYDRRDPSPSVETALRLGPSLIGFSVIFQFTLGEFAALASALRASGCTAHLTAGGHFPSLRPAEALDAVPALDSVVRFEGERTVVELLRHLDRPESWASIPGLVFRRDGRVVVNPPRPLVADLESLPPPARGEPRFLTRGVGVASMLASRGCLYDCAFCSIRQFYGSAPGPLRRTRSPEAVVAEMRALADDRGVRFFIFQDDDFTAPTAAQRRWVRAFVEALDRAALSRRVGWKISCRVDAVEPELFALARDHGLCSVYLGVESGSAAGLKTLNKRVTVAENVRALEVLTSLGIAFDMGFMLFDPDSTFDTLRENLAFLRESTGDGACPADFAKMLPYAGTPIEARLRREGRLTGGWTEPDYEFLDPRIDLYALYVAQVFHSRNADPLGLLERLRLARFDQVLMSRLERDPRGREYESRWRAVTARANLAALDALDEGLAFVRARDERAVMAQWDQLGAYARREWQAEIDLQRELDEVLKEYAPELYRGYRDEVERRRAEDGAGSLPFSVAVA